MDLIGNCYKDFFYFFLHEDSAKYDLKIHTVFFPKKFLILDCEVFCTYLQNCATGGPHQLYLFFDGIDMSSVKLYVLSQQLPALLIPPPCNIREGMLGQVLMEML